MPNQKIYLNVGCGNRYHPEWVNIDISPQGAGVMKHDLRLGIPFAENQCDVVYCSAVIEHMRRPDGAAFLTECLRVLKPGGIIRIGVPDLEHTCRLYLSKLAEALQGDETAGYDYDWMLLELLDQTVRETSGGGMAEYLRQDPLLNEKFIFDRIGEEGRQLVQMLRGRGGQTTDARWTMLRRVKHVLWSLPGIGKRWLFRALLGSENMRALDIGRFRLAGEVHHWAYDRYSLASLLYRSGFRNCQLCDATVSRIPDWVRYHLDTLSGGQVIKPDLFFMEAVKPEIRENTQLSA
jgi:SAM-dependent methyltransferase